jgi:hypothetical protein
MGPGSEPKLDILGISHADGAITVDLALGLETLYPISMQCICPPSDLVIQQMAVTLQHAYETTDPLIVLERGQPSLGLGGENVDWPVAAR